LIRNALRIGVIVPLLYFGAQFAAIPFYPGYDIVRQSASELGSDRSNRPHVLNIGATITGIAAIIASFGLLHGLKRAGTPWPLAWLVCLAVISTGAAAIWAGYYSLPDPRHNPRAIGAGAFLLPLLFAAALWKPARGSAVKVYLIANLLLFVALIPVMSGALMPVDAFRGVLQRVAAAVLYLPIGVVSAFLLSREP
jgi:Protein of unknown function (DUF998)